MCQTAWKRASGSQTGAAGVVQAVDLLRKVAQRKDLPCSAREYALTALMKLSARLPGTVPAVKASLGPLVCLDARDKTQLRLDVLCSSCCPSP